VWIVFHCFDIESGELEMREEIARVFGWRAWQRERVCVSVREKGGTCKSSVEQRN
jgi:hypothetical protein